MAENKKRVDARVIVAIIFMVSGGVLLASGQSGVGIVMLIVGGVLLGASKRGARKATALKDSPNVKPADKP